MHRCNVALVLKTLLFYLSCCCFALAFGISEERRLVLRDQAREAFYHAYNGYMDHGFPFDELDPIECIGKGRDREHPDNSSVNDVLGGYLLTLVDTLDSLAILGDREEFSKAVKNTVTYLKDFDIDSRVQVFEVTIRMLGGLLSAHIIATDENDVLGMRLDRNGTYTGELLQLARDLGYRLLPAFEASPSGAPYPRTNLKYGFPVGETPSTCTAGVGSLILEFGTLSRLTNETVFERVAQHALQELWMSRTKANMLGNEYDVVGQKWTGFVSGIGAGVDSYFEYLLKAHVYLGDDDYLQMFEATYSAILQHVRDSMAGYAFFNVNILSKEVSTNWVDSLSAFFPGLMVLAGDVEGAESAYLLYYHLWRRFRAMPERFNLASREPNIPFYPLRPEFIESTYHLYRATGDRFYLDVGEMVLADLNSLYRTSCGFATMQNIHTGKLEGRMESFALSETLKYLYLLFDEENPLHKSHSHYVFTTEGHLLLPLSPVRDGSAQYPHHSSFALRRLLHSNMAPKKVRPALYNISNIRRKLRSLHPDDMFAVPVHVPSTQNVSRARMPSRKCPAGRALRSKSVHGNSNSDNAGNSGDPAVSFNHSTTSARLFDEPTPAHLQSPLEQLYNIQQLARAIHQISPDAGSEQQQQLISLHLNAASVTMPLRADFYTTGLLVDNSDQQTGLMPLSVGYESRGYAGTASINSSLAAALDYSGMCADPATITFSRRQEIWKTSLLSATRSDADRLGIRVPPSYAKTWLAPYTQQFSFMEFLFSRATKRQVFVWNTPWKTRTRHGVPLLKDVWDESIDPSTDNIVSGERRSTAHHGFLFGHIRNAGETPARRIVVTNGAAQVMTDYIVVRATVDIPLQAFDEEPQTNNGKATNSTKRMQEMANTTGYNNTSALGLQGYDDACQKDGDKRTCAGNANKSEAWISMASGRLQGMHRRRSYVGRLADFSELSLYRNDVPFMGFQPAELVVQDMHGLLADSGCNEYSASESKRVRHKIVAARTGNGCTTRRKAIHAMNAGATALLIADEDSEYSQASRRKTDAQKRQNQRENENTENQTHNRMQKQIPKEKEQADDGGKSGTQFTFGKCRASAVFATACLADIDANQGQDNAKAPENYNSRGCDISSAQSDIERLAQQIDMPVVIISQSVFEELEGYLVSGLRVSIELF